MNQLATPLNDPNDFSNSFIGSDDDDQIRDQIENMFTAHSTDAYINEIVITRKKDCLDVAVSLSQVDRDGYMNDAAIEFDPRFKFSHADGSFNGDDWSYEDTLLGKMANKNILIHESCSMRSYCDDNSDAYAMVTLSFYTDEAILVNNFHEKKNNYILTTLNQKFRDFQSTFNELSYDYSMEKQAAFIKENFNNPVFHAGLSGIENKQLFELINPTDDNHSRPSLF